MSEEMLTRAQVLKVLGVSRTTLWRWQAAGEFPSPLRLGDATFRWRRAEIEAWLESRRT